MRKSVIMATLALLCFAFFACNNNNSEATPASVAKQWCELNGKAARASEGAEKRAAEAAVDQFEDELDKKYKSNAAFMKEVEKEIEKCEDASERD